MDLAVRMGTVMDHQVGRGIEHQYGANDIAVHEPSLIHSLHTNPIKHLQLNLCKARVMVNHLV